MEDIDAIVGERFRELQKNLKKPLVFFDLETTGVSTTRDRIVEMTMIKITKKSVEDPIMIRMNPGVPIPTGASEVHGIYDEDVADCKSFADYAEEIAKSIEGCDFAGYNAQKYDVPLLQAEFDRVNFDIDLSKGVVVDPIVIFKQRMRKDLTSAFRYYAGKQLTDAHSSLADTLAALEVFSEQLELYDDLPTNVPELSSGSIKKPKKDDGENRHFLLKEGKYYFKFGKHNGKSLDSPLVQDYLKWMMNQKPPKEFPSDTVAIIKEHLNKKKAA